MPVTDICPTLGGDTKLNAQKQPEIVSLWCSKTSNDIKMKLVKHCYVTSKIPSLVHGV